MSDRFKRTEILLGEEGVKKLSASRVAVFGIGGVGSFAIEALARAGVGALDIVDNDVVSETNINRQLIALTSTVGRRKTEVMAERIADINPECRVIRHDCFFLPENSGEFDFGEYDYVVDAIDTVSGKIALVMAAHEAGTPVICSMGAGNKLDPAVFKVADLYDTKVCPLARVMRRELKKRGVERLKVVYSEELPVTGGPCDEQPPEGKRAVPGSVSFVPPVAGYILASEVIKDLIKEG